MGETLVAEMATAVAGTGCAMTGAAEPEAGLLAPPELPQGMRRPRLLLLEVDAPMLKMDEKQRTTDQEIGLCQ